MAVNSRTNTIYVTNPAGNNVTVIDGTTNKTTTSPSEPCPTEWRLTK